MWTAVNNHWAHPMHCAVCVRDHPLRVSEEINRLLLAVRYFLSKSKPALGHSAGERELVTSYCR
jgi:hypothetical protein